MRDEELETASIACEPCRHKKCKCDRRLPICTQCESSPARCHYPEKNRRGIPAGYVNALEKRLAETERALFFALAEIHAGAVTHDDYDTPALQQTMRTSVLSDPTPTTQQDKAELMASWARNPLANRGHAQAWYEANQGEAALPAFVNPGTDVTRGSVDAVTPAISSTVTSTSSGRPVAHLHGESQAERVSSGNFASENTQRSSHRGSTRQGRFPGWAESHLGMPPTDVRNEGDTPSARNISQASKAKKFARENTNIYF